LGGVSSRLSFTQEKMAATFEQSRLKGRPCCFFLAGISSQRVDPEGISQFVRKILVDRFLSPPKLRSLFKRNDLKGLLILCSKIILTLWSFMESINVVYN